MSPSPVTYTEQDGIAELALASAPCNEIGVVLIEALEKALDQLERGPAKVVLVHSLQAGFSAGADLRGLYEAIVGRSPAEFMPEVAAVLDRVHALMARFDALPLPTIAVIHGVCFGGGFELALTCDMLVCDRSARFCFPESRLGLIPGFGGIPRLQREQVPNAVMRDLLFSGRSLSARRALELGIVSQVVAPGQALAAARDCARQVALFDSAVLAAAKRFAKPLPEAALAEEKRVFLELFKQPRVVAALAEFVGRTDAMPYQPMPKEKTL